jgi:hypothetical protein
MQLKDKAMLDQVRNTENFTNIELPANSLVPSVSVRNFTDRFSQIILPLIEVLHSKDIRNHSVWGKLIPYNQVNYGDFSSRSEGHMLRIDGMLGDDQKFRFSEIDFVPGGLGVVSSNLQNLERDNFIQTFINWLETFDAKQILLATGTKTTLWGENTYIAELLKSKGVNFERVNIDLIEELSKDQLVLRQFYKSECLNSQPIGRYLTKEPWLDSKAIFALVHDTRMSQILSDALGQLNLLFLRETMPETYIYPILKKHPASSFIDLLENEDFENWVIKATEVETDFCWGCRSVVIGRMYKNLPSATLKNAFLNGESPDPEKNVGKTPILQRFHLSTEMSQIWNALVKRAKPSEFLKLIGEELDENIVNLPATSAVRSRLAIHFFVSNTQEKVFCPNYGYFTLRQSHLAHAERDSIEGAFKIV